MTHTTDTPAREAAGNRDAVPAGAAVPPEVAALRVVVVADEAAGMQALRLLTKCGCQIAAVLAAPATRANGMSSVWSLAEQLRLPTWPAEGVRDGRYAAAIRDAGVDLLLNVYALHVIHAELLTIPRLGAYNLHPGPLPRYAGLNSVSWALYRGEPAHGVTLHRMLPAIDAGDIAFQSTFSIEESDTALTLYAKCGRAGMELIRRLIEAAAREAIPSAPQDLSRREVFRRSDVPQNGRLCWDRPARDVVNFVRACDYHPFPSPWGYPRSRLGAQALAIGRARRTERESGASPGTVVATDGGACDIATRDERIRIERIEVDGRSLEPGAVLKIGDCLADG